MTDGISIVELTVEWLTGKPNEWKSRVLRLDLSVDALGISPEAAETVVVLCRDGMSFGPALRAAEALGQQADS